MEVVGEIEEVSDEVGVVDSDGNVTTEILGDTVTDGLDESEIVGEINDVISDDDAEADGVTS